MPQLRAYRGIHLDFEGRPDPGRELVRDDAPCLYALSTRFEVNGEPRVRQGFLAAARLAPQEPGRVRHPEPAEEAAVRRELERIRATRLQASPALLLHEDGGRAEAILAPVREQSPDALATTDDGARHELWRVSDEAIIRAVTEAVAPAPAVLIDGEDRWEAGLGWSGDCLLAGEPPGAQDFALACFVSETDRGLAVVPTHRVLRAPVPDPARLALLLGEHFEVDELPEDPTRPVGLRWALRRLAEAGKEGHAFVIVTGADRRARLLTLREGVDRTHVHAMPKNPTLRGVDVALLHALVLQNVLGLSPEEQGQVLEYEEDAGRAIAAGAPMVMLLNPAPPWQLRAVAEAGVSMPRGSGHLFPGVPSGLALFAVDPRDGG